MHATDYRAAVPADLSIASGPNVYARIIDAHYAQAEKADEARAGAALVRFALRNPTIRTGAECERLLTQTDRQRRTARDTMPTASATQQTEENR